MTNEVYEYFKEKYEKTIFRVVPGSWPDFIDKKEVDDWIKLGESLFNIKSK